MIDDRNLDGSTDTNLPESLGETVFEESNIPPELAAQQKHLQELETQSQQQQPIEQPKRKEASRDQNFAAMRQKLEQIERERDEALRRLKEKEDDNDVNLGPDELAEGKHISKVQKEVKRLKEELQNYKAQTIHATTEARLKAQYADFDSVVTQDTVTQLKEQYPELAATLQASTDLYSQAVSAYTMIKKLGIVPESTYAAERTRAQTNAYKPRPTVSVSPQQGESPLSKANAFADGLSDELKAQLLKEMNSSRRGY